MGALGQRVLVRWAVDIKLPFEWGKATREHNDGCVLIPHTPVAGLVLCMYIYVHA